MRTHEMRKPDVEARRLSIRRGLVKRPDAAKSNEWHRRSSSPAETDLLGRMIGRCLRGGDVMALYGEVGTGKTALIRGAAAGMGADADEVSSPTFVLVQEYRGRLRLVHADLYRIETAAELPDLGLSDYVDDSTAMAVEWAKKAGSELPHDRLEILLSHSGKTSRYLLFKATGARSRTLLSRIRKRWAARKRPQRHPTTEQRR